MRRTTVEERQLLFLTLWAAGHSVKDEREAASGAKKLRQMSAPRTGREKVKLFCWLLNYYK